MALRVDRDLRAREIFVAARALILEHGYGGLTLRSLADELGGSMTLVTHYFDSHAELMNSYLEFELEEFERELQSLEQGEDALRRLRIFIDWFLPNDPTSWREERGRVLLLVQVPRDANWLKPYLTQLEDRMTALLQSHLEPLVAAEQLPLAVDVLRLTLNGIALSAVEHPESWSAAQQVAVVARVVDSFSLNGEVTFASTT